MAEAATRIDVESRSQALGARIRERRRAAGMTVRGLAASTGLSASLISQVERGRATPSVASLWSIATELGLSDADLFSDSEVVADVAADGGGRTSTEPVQAQETRKTITLQGGIQWERLTSSSDDEVEFVCLVYPPGAASCEEGALHRHGGREFGYVLSGTLGVRIGFDEYVVRENDSISFDSSMPHRLWAMGDEPMRAIWMVINRRADPRSKLFS
jgi:transcriptional regulator with XRE-family HTH domain